MADIFGVMRLQAWPGRGKCTALSTTYMTHIRQILRKYSANTLNTLGQLDHIFHVFASNMRSIFANMWPDICFILLHPVRWVHIGTGAVTILRWVTVGPPCSPLPALSAALPPPIHRHTSARDARCRTLQITTTMACDLHQVALGGSGGVGSRGAAGWAWGATAGRLAAVGS
jgi:hypothetical protein